MCMSCSTHLLQAVGLKNDLGTCLGSLPRDAALSNWVGGPQAPPTWRTMASRAAHSRRELRNPWRSRISPTRRRHGARYKSIMLTDRIQAGPQAAREGLRSTLRQPPRRQPDGREAAPAAGSGLAHNCSQLQSAEGPEMYIKVARAASSPARRAPPRPGQWGSISR